MPVSTISARILPIVVFTVRPETLVGHKCSSNGSHEMVFVLDVKMLTLESSKEGKPEPIAKSYPQALVFKQANIAAVAVGTRKDAIGKFLSIRHISRAVCPVITSINT